MYTYFGPLRIKKVNGSATTVYIYSGSKPIVEYLNGTLSKEYVYSGSALVATIAGGATTYHHPDHLSNRVETDSNGAPVRTFGQLPFGEAWYETGTADKLKFTSYERDSEAGETGLDYAMFRHYSPGLGRFMSADLLAGHPHAPQSLNRYSYTLNDPGNVADPLGLDPPCYADWGTCNLQPPPCTHDECWNNGSGANNGGGGGQHPPLGDGGNGGGGGGGGANKGLPKNLQEALARCLDKLFGVTLTSFDPSSHGHNGSFVGTGEGGRQFTFANDATTFTVADLNMIVFGTKEAPTSDENMKGMTREGTIVTKFWLKYIPDYFSTRTFSLAISYTASDLGTSDILSTQIHELGHQIAQTLGKEPKNAGDESKTPYGNKLQDCFNQEAKRK